MVQTLFCPHVPLIAGIVFDMLLAPLSWLIPASLTILWCDHRAQTYLVMLFLIIWSPRFLEGRPFCSKGCEIERWFHDYLLLGGACSPRRQRIALVPPLTSISLK